MQRKIQNIKLLATFWGTIDFVYVASRSKGLHASPLSLLRPGWGDVKRDSFSLQECGKGRPFGSWIIIHCYFCLHIFNLCSPVWMLTRWVTLSDRCLESLFTVASLCFVLSFCVSLKWRPFHYIHLKVHLIVYLFIIYIQWASHKRRNAQKKKILAAYSTRS